MKLLLALSILFIHNICFAIPIEVETYTSLAWQLAICPICGEKTSLYQDLDSLKMAVCSDACKHYLKFRENHRFYVTFDYTVDEKKDMKIKELNKKIEELKKEIEKLRSISK